MPTSATDTSSAAGANATAEADKSTRHLAFDAPWGWLASGWHDLWSIPHISLTYGAIFASIAGMLALGLWLEGWQSLFLALAGGFLLVGPLFGVGLYAASERISHGAPVRLMDVLTAGIHARGQLSFFGVMLMFTYLIWLQLVFLLLMLFLGPTGFPPPSQFMRTLLFTTNGLGLLITGSIVGGLIAAGVFVTSVIAVPTLLAEPVDAVTAASSSVRAVFANPKPMALWAALIAAVMVAGFVTLFLGLVVAFPLIGHATWHAYAELQKKRPPTL